MRLFLRFPGHNLPISTHTKKKKKKNRKSFSVTWFQQNLSFQSSATTATATTGSSSSSSSGSGSSSSSSSKQQQSLLTHLIDTGKSYLAEHAATREAAGIMLARLFSRPDLEHLYLQEFFEWCVSAVQNNKTNLHLVTGVHQALFQVIRHAPRSALQNRVSIVFENLVKGSRWASNRSGLLRKLTLKVAQRVGLTYLKPVVASWRYQRGTRNLMANISQATAKTSANHATPGSGNTAIKSASAGEEGEVGIDHSDDEEIPEEVDEVVDQLLQGLKDQDTIVRWSAAKGIGRITMNLPSDFADEVVEAVLSNFNDGEGDGAWHGGCFALGELARRGLLLPSRLGAVVPLVLRALLFDVRTGTHSVGAHVRDAACYVIWAFARAYAPDVMSPYVAKLARGLLCVAVFDREINCRRAAAAAFQENVGRQGNFPHGIAINTCADYFTLGNRSAAYTSIALFIAQFEEYKVHFIDHLASVKTKHWDPLVRQITAQGLAKLTTAPDGAEYVIRAVLPELIGGAVSLDICERHGSVLAIAETLVVLCTELKCTLPKDLQEDIMSLPVRMEEKACFKGKGSAVMRPVLCRLLECIAIAKLPLSRERVDILQAMIDANLLKQASEEIQAAAAAALKVFLPQYWDFSISEQAARAHTWAQKYLDILWKNDNEVGCRGAALGVAALPLPLLRSPPPPPPSLPSSAPSGQSSPPSSSPSSPSSPAAHTAHTADTAADTAADTVADPRLGSVVNVLCAAVDFEIYKDVETRTNSVRALAAVAEAIAPAGLLDRAVTGPFIDKRVAMAEKRRKARALKAVKGDASKLKEEKQVIYVYDTHDFMYSAGAGSRQQTEGGEGGDEKKKEEKEGEENREATEAAEGGGAQVEERYLVFEKMARALLKALCDYATDNRGDIGSWVREAAMESLYTLLILMATNKLLSTQLAHLVVQGVCKQWMEKINKIRGAAGTILQKMVTAPLLRPYIPSCSALATVMGSASSSPLPDWSSPAVTYPVGACLLRLQDYHKSLFCGIVIAVGGLSEQRSCAESLIAFAKSETEGDQKQQQQDAKVEDSNIQIEDSNIQIAGQNLKGSLGEDLSDAEKRAMVLASSVCYVFSTYKRLPRVITPLFKTLDILISNGCFDVLDIERFDFGHQVLQYLKGEVKNSKNAAKVLASVNVFAGLLAFGGKLRDTALQAVLEVLLVHPFPKVRRMAAEELYSRLLAYDSHIDDDKLEAVLSVLARTPWDGDLDFAKQQRDRLYSPLGLELIAGKMKTNSNYGLFVPEESKGYADLVKEMGF